MSGTNVRLPTVGWTEMPGKPQWVGQSATGHCVFNPQNNNDAGRYQDSPPVTEEESEARKVEATYSEHVNARVRHHTGV